MEKTKVTVITVCYNIIKNKRLNFLIQNFQSVNNQSYKNIEHLVIDGASTDGTVEVLKEYEKKGWIKYISEPDKGIFDAMNKGHKMAQGEYVLVLNSDDWYASEDVIENMVQTITKNKADYVFGNQECWNIDGFHALGKSEPQIFWRYMPFNHPTIMIKNSVVKELGYYRTDFDTVEDYRFVIDLILKDYKGVYTDKTIVNFRLGGASYDQKTLTSFYDFHYRRLAKLYMWFYSKFDKRLDEEKIIQNYMWDIGGKFDELFFIKLMRYMISLKLKNFNYEQFFQDVTNLKNNLTRSTEKEEIKKIDVSEIKIQKCFTKRYKLWGIPILKIKADKKRVKYKIFDFIPLLTLKIK